MTQKNDSEKLEIYSVNWLHISILHASLGVMTSRPSSLNNIILQYDNWEYGSNSAQLGLPNMKNRDL